MYRYKKTEWVAILLEPQGDNFFYGRIIEVIETHTEIKGAKYSHVLGGI